MAAAKQIIVFLMDKVTRYNCFTILEKMVDQFSVWQNYPQSIGKAYK